MDAIYFLNLISTLIVAAAFLLTIVEENRS